MDVPAVGRRLRELRVAAGLSLSEVARRSGLGKGTLSELETGRRNPTLETLFAVTGALGLPLSSALEEGARASGPAVDAWLVERAGAAEVYRLRVRPGAVQVSAPHAPGVREQVLVVAGRLGLNDTLLGPGEQISYAGDVPHRWEALDDAAVSAVLVMRWP